MAGTGLRSAWWVYFVVPTADLLHAHRERSFRYGYLHYVVIGSIVATGGGAACGRVLHRAPFQARLGGNGADGRHTVAAYIASVYLLYTLLVRTYDVFHALLVVLTAAVLIAAVVLAAQGVPMTSCLLIVTLAPVVTVVGFELLGHRHAEEAIAQEFGRETDRGKSNR